MVVSLADSKSSIEELYGIGKNPITLIRKKTLSGKWLEGFRASGDVLVEWTTEELTSLCPKTGQPDFCKLTVEYIPNKLCLELKSAKYYIVSFRTEGHFYEELINLIYQDFFKFLSPKFLKITGVFNSRGGMVEKVTACSSKESNA